MKQPAKIEITSQFEEFFEKNFYDGYIIEADGKKIIEFFDNDSDLFCLTVDKNDITLKRTGKENYTMFLQENKENYILPHPHNEGIIKLLTNKILQKQTANSYELFFSYSFAGINGHFSKIKLKCLKI